MAGMENIQGYWNTPRHSGNRNISRIRAFGMCRKDYPSIKMPESTAEFTVSDRIILHTLHDSSININFKAGIVVHGFNLSTLEREARISLRF